MRAKHCKRQIIKNKEKDRLARIERERDRDVDKQEKKQEIESLDKYNNKYEKIDSEKRSRF